MQIVPLKAEFNRFLKELPAVLKEFVFEIENMANYLVPIVLKYVQPEYLVRSLSSSDSCRRTRLTRSGSSTT